MNNKLAYLIIFFFGFILYGNTIKHEFALDDNRLIVQNKDITQFNLFSLATHGTYFGVNNVNSGAYRPVTMIVFANIWKISNGVPLGFHLCNIIFNIFCTILIFRILTRFFDSNNISKITILLISCMFLALPIHTEVVANVKSLDELLCLFFGLLAITLYLDVKPKIYLSFSCILISILSKETGLIFIPIFAYLIWKQKDENTKIKLLYLSLIVIAYIILRESFLDNGKKIIMLAENNSLVLIKNTTHLLATKIYILGLYFYKCLWAVPFNWDYNFIIKEKTLTDPSVLASVLLLISSMYLFIKNYKNSNHISLSILWFWLPLMLTSNFIFLIPSSFGERFVFLSTVGLVILITQLITTFKISKHIINGGLIIIVLIFSNQTIVRAKQWKSGEYLNECEIKYSTSRRVILSQAALINNRIQKIKENSYSNKNSINSKLDSVIVLSKKVLDIYPNTCEPNPYFLLGSSYVDLGNLEIAEKYLIIADSLCSISKKTGDLNVYEYANICNKLGYIYGKKQNLDLALKYYLKAVEDDPSHKPAIGNIGAIFYAKNDYKNAKIYFEKLYQLDHTNEKAIKYLKLLEKL